MEFEYIQHNMKPKAICKVQQIPKLKPMLNNLVKSMDTQASSSPSPAFLPFFLNLCFTYVKHDLRRLKIINL